MALGLVGLLVLAALLLKIPYYAVAPGSAVEVTGLVEVAGGPTFPPEGKVYLTTVRLGQVTLLQAVQGWLDPTVDVVAQHRVIPPEVPPSRLRDFNLQQMDDSKQRAVGVAFEQLGYDAIAGAGAEVVQVVDGSPVDGALAPGDVVVGLGGAPVATHHDVLALLAQRQPGEATTIDVVRVATGEEQTLAIGALGENPDGPERAFLGATLRTLDFRFDFPFQVDIASERIGGPSAGLAFTLEILDLLTAGELTGGLRVAATGTIELDGSVGPVGGVTQKTAAVNQAGIDLFLVPRAELADAIRLAVDGVAVQPVDTLSDALRALSDAGGDPLVAHRQE